MRTTGAAVVLAALIGGGIVVPLTGAAHADGQTVTVTPSTGLVNKQTVVVVGSGFAADEAVYAAECNSKVLGSLSTNDCDASTLIPGQTDGSGDVTFSGFPVYSGSSYSDNDHGACNSTSPCVVGIVNSLVSPTEAGGAAVAFAATTPPPAVKTTTSVSVRPKSAKAGRTITVTAKTTRRSANGRLAGKVVFTDNGKKFGSVKEAASGRVHTTLKLAKGKNHIVVAYGGNVGYKPSKGTVTVKATVAVTRR